MTYLPHPPTTSSCPDVGAWRAWLDREAGEQSVGLGDHLAVCAACWETMSELRQNAAYAQAALDLLNDPAETRDLPPGVLTFPRRASAIGVPAAVTGATDAGAESVRRRSARALDDAGRTTPPIEAAARPVGILTVDPHTTSPKEQQFVTNTLRSTPWRVALGGLAAAAALTFLVGFTEQGQALAAQFLAQFRSERFSVVTVDPRSGFKGVALLEQLGTVQGPTGPGEGVKVDSIAEASQRVGFAVKQPDPAALPSGVDHSPRILVMPARTTRFTFDREKAAAYFQAQGQNASLPEKFDGTSLVVSVPAAVLLQYGQSGAKPEDSKMVMIGQANELVVGTEGGVTLAEMRDFLLGLPGLPPELVQQMRALQDWRTTLPIPVPVDRVNWQQTSIAGTEGLILTDTTGLGTGAIWQKDGRVYGVAGTLTADDVRRVANSLR